LPASGFERRSVVRVLPLGKGEYREPGLQENSVRDFTGRRTPPLRPVYCANLCLELKRFSLKNSLFDEHSPRFFKNKTAEKAVFVLKNRLDYKPNFTSTYIALLSSF